MTVGLTSRQTQIVKALIDEYIATAEPVGSLALEKKYTLGVSPATIRNEMVNLTKMGYLQQPHTSAGRIPTPLAMKFYISQLMEEKQMSFSDEVKMKEEMLDAKNDFDKIMSRATEELAEKTQGLAVAATDQGEIWKAGYAGIFDSPEFQNWEVCQNIFSLLDEARMLDEVFFQRLTGMSPVEVLFDVNWPFFDNFSFVATRFKIKGHIGAIGVVSPVRKSPTVIPAMKYFHNLIEELFA